MSKQLSTLRNQVASVNQTIRRKFPQAAMFASFSLVAGERLGERVTGTRKRRTALLALAGVMVMVEPVAAQASCSGGFLEFISFLKNLSIQAAGMFLIVMILGGMVLKALPIAGTDRAGNAVLGGVVVAVVFVVLAVTLVDIADSVLGFDLNPECNLGGGGGG